jgi:hypothetical protein
MSKFVCYCANARGYTVQTIVDGELVAEYSQGNAHGDSTTVLTPGPWELWTKQHS